MLQSHFGTNGKQAGRADARHGLLTQRGYNIESLTVARTLDPTLSRMTIVVDVEATMRPQVIKQMNKLINVLQATDLTEAPAVNPRTGAGAHPHAARDAHGGAERGRDFRRPRGGFLHRRLRHRSDGRPGKVGRIYRCDAQLRRDRCDAFRRRWPSRLITRSCAAAAGSDAAAGQTGNYRRC